MPISGEISGRVVQSFQITLKDGQYASAVVDHHGIALVVRLVDAAGVVQIEKRSEEIDGRDVLEFASEKAAEFQIRVATRFPKAEAGTYQIAIGELRAAGERDQLLYEARRRYAESLRVFQSGAYRDAQSAGERSLEIRERLLGQDHVDVAASLDWVGLIYAARNDYVKADELCRRALAINERAFGSDHPAVAENLISLAKNARSNGNYAEAERLAKRAVSITTGHFGADHPMVAASLGTLADVYVFKTDYLASEKVSDQALDIVARAFGPEDQTYADFALRASRAQLFLGRYARAEELTLLALKTTEQLNAPDSPLVGVVVASLAGVYFSKGDNIKAEETFQRALTIYRKSFGNDHLVVGQIYNNLGLLAFRRGDDENAEGDFAKALEIRERLVGPSDPVVGAILNNMGRLYHKKRDYTKAAEFYGRALAINEKAFGSDSPEISAALANLGIVAKEAGDYLRAESYYRRSLAIREKALGPNHPDVGLTVGNLGILYRDTGDYARAEPMLLRELTINERSFGPDHPNVARNLSSLAQLYSSKGDMANALQTLQRIVTVQEKNLPLNLAAGSERQKLAYFGPFGSTLEKIISFQVRENPSSAEARDLAATAVLQRKGRVLDAMADNLGALRHRSETEDVALLDRLGGVTSQLASLVLNGPQRIPLDEHQQRIKTLSQQRETLENDVSRRSAGYYERTNAATLQDIKGAIPSDAALVEFAVYRPFDPKTRVEQGSSAADPRYVAYVVHNSGDVSWKELGPAREIDETVATLRLALRDPQSADVKRRARELDEKILQPLRQMVGEATHLLISPDGQLDLIPFEALVDEQGRYLVERYSISYLTTGRDLLRLQVPRASKSEPLVVADPLFGEPPPATEAAGSSPTRASRKIARRSIVIADNLSSVYFAPLAGTGVEARTIKSLFPDARLLTKSQATKGALARAEAPRILHIATHGFFLNPTDAVNNPLIRSGLALTGANHRGGDQDEGILTALEASNLNLWGTKLVTLSACDTGIGDVRTGEGVFGLRRAFFLAGAETLVMSLWPVSDYVTREMMTTYYGGLKRGLGRGDALRQAQLAMLARGGRQHPFYWASFIQAGEWANLDGRR